MGAATRRGPRQPLVQIVEFADFRCPHCARLQPELYQLLANYPARVGLAFVHVPIVAPDSARVAIAVEAAGRQGAFWGMHDAVFARVGQPLEEKDLRRIAGELDLDVRRFSADLRDPELEEHVRSDLAKAEAIGVDATPALLINGRLYIGFQTAEQLAWLVDEELERLAR